MFPLRDGIHNDTTTVFELVPLITFRVRHSPGEMYIDNGRLCVCLSLAAFPHYCTDPDVT